MFCLKRCVIHPIAESRLAAMIVGGAGTTCHYGKAARQMPSSMWAVCRSQAMMLKTQAWILDTCIWVEQFGRSSCYAWKYFRKESARHKVVVLLKESSFLGKHHPSISQNSQLSSHSCERTKTRIRVFDDVTR